LEWGTGGFIVGVFCGVIGVFDSRHQHKRRRDSGAVPSSGAG
jgi:hypothetical protein